MSLAPGTRLGAYDIIALIGAGGMGEVYRARDTRLQRDAAIKVLPDAFASDADRVARFTREAQVLASLNHPRIGPVINRNFDLHPDGKRVALAKVPDAGMSRADKVVFVFNVFDGLRKVVPKSK